MSIVLAIIGWTFFALAILVGLGLDIVGLFGNWIILAATLIAYLASGRHYFSVTAVIVLFFLAMFGEVIDALAAGYGAKRFGGAKGTMGAALAGTIVGAIVGTPVPIIGSLIGACIGAFIGAVLYEFVVRERQVHEAVKSGFGAALGKVLGTLGKLIVGLAMVIALFLML